MKNKEKAIRCLSGLFFICGLIWAGFCFPLLFKTPMLIFSDDPLGHKVESFIYTIWISLGYWIWFGWSLRMKGIRMIKSSRAFWSISFIQNAVFGAVFAIEDSNFTIFLAWWIISSIFSIIMYFYDTDEIQSITS